MGVTFGGKRRREGRGRLRQYSIFSLLLHTLHHTPMQLLPGLHLLLAWSPRLLGRRDAGGTGPRTTVCYHHVSFLRECGEVVRDHSESRSG